MARHIDELKIEALRGIQELSLPQLGQVNLLVGDNNSGKTTVLEAIALFCRPLDPLEWLGVARRRNIKSSRESLLEGVRWLFPQNQADFDDPYYEGEVQIKGRGTFPCLEVRARFDGFGADEEESESSDWVDEYEDESESAASEEDEGSFGGTGSLPARGADMTLSASMAPDGHWIKNQFQLFEDERFIKREPPMEPKLEVATISPFSHRVEPLQVSRLSEATLSRSKANVLQCLRLIDPRVEELTILSRSGVRPTLWLRREITGYSPLYTLGDGIRRVLTMALGVIDTQNGILLIDEIETSIHKDALVDVFQWLVRLTVQFNVQLFATTHSLEAIDAVLSAQKETLDNVVAFRLPPPDSSRPPARFPGEALYDLRYESGKEVR